MIFNVNTMGAKNNEEPERIKTLEKEVYKVSKSESKDKIDKWAR